MRIAFIILLSLPMLFSYREALQLIPTTIEGVVLDQASGMAIDKVHVYTVNGEEEAFSGTDGKFKLQTWKPLPVTLTVECQGYKAERTVIRSAASKAIIKLSKSGK